MGTLRFYGGLVWEQSSFSPNKVLEIQIENESEQEVFLSEEALLVPALIDFHCHLWAPGASAVGVTDTEYLSSGIAACGDAGTFGYDGWEQADRLWQNSLLQVRSWLSVLPEGLTIYPNPNPTKPENISLERLLETAAISNGRLLGYKVRLGQKDEANDRGLLKLAREAADKSNLKVMVHITDSNLSIDEVVENLRPGDVLTHPYHGNRGNILDNSGNVSNALKDSIESGLILDVAQGSKHFSWSIFKKAVAEGIRPHTISTDLVRKTWKKDPVNDLSYVLSRFLAAGFTKEEVITSALDKPLELLGLSINPNENLVVLEPNLAPIKYADSIGETINGNVLYKPTYYINRGKSIFLSESLV
ncbi:hypothetical protein [Fredinandcohnia onubensis]|uniref:hypothetical protein n=1 Tax=Fredinandcohnia onubensis TaxID=1571209 RepID=UPI000C0C098F|nr:hypothetical protein [Fredinandcohnia onubensis]